mgnify:CR=1 FL=1
MAIVHHHLIYQAKVDTNLDENSEEELKKFLYDLLGVIDMKCLIPAQLKFSHQKAWTGMVGVITSHIAFHYWVPEQYLQLDIYSCKVFDRKKTINFLKEFWKSRNVKALFIDRDIDKNFDITRIE